MPRYGAYTDVSAASADLETRLSQLALQSAPVFNVKHPTYGATGNGATDDTTAIQAAITAAENAGGGTVFLPDGTYLVTSTLVIAASQTRTIKIVGRGVRDCRIQANGAIGTVIRCGAAVPDASGTTTNGHYYGELEGFNIYAGAGADAATALKMVEPHQWIVRNVTIEGFSAAGGTGLHLRGSTTTGLGSAAAPHAWRNLFVRVQVVTTRKPLLIENGDENDFVSCNFSLPTGIVAAANTLNAIEITQGHNNRFFGCVCGGDTDPTYRGAYVGVKITAPTAGDNHHHQFYGLVVEGFSRGFWHGNDSSFCVGTTVVGYNASIVDTHYLDSGAQTGNGFSLESHLHHYAIRNTRLDYNDAVGFADGATTPSVQKANVFTTSNTGATSITNFTNGVNGQVIFVRLDANTTLVHGTIRLHGRVDLKGDATGKVVCLVNVGGGAWWEIGATAEDILGPSTDRGDANVTLTAGTDSATQRFATNLTANRTVTLSGTGASKGAKFRVVRTGLGAFTLDVGGLKTIPSATAAFVDVEHTGSAWILTAYGTL